MKLLAAISAAFAALAAAVPTATDNAVAARDDTSINTANLISRGYDPDYLGPCQKQGCLHCCTDRFTLCEHCACGPTAHWPPKDCEGKGSASSLETLQVREPVDVSPIPEPILARQPRPCDSLCNKYKCCRGTEWCHCTPEQLDALEAGTLSIRDVPEVQEPEVAVRQLETSPVPEPILAVRQSRECDSLCRKYKCCRGGRWCRCSPEQLDAFEAAAELDVSVVSF